MLFRSGCLLAALTYFPLFQSLAAAANPALHEAQARAPVTVIADPADCSVQFDPIGRNRFDRRSCDIAKAWLARAGISYANQAAPAGTVARVRIGTAELASVDPRGLSAEERGAAITAFQAQLQEGSAAAGYPRAADPARIDKVRVVAILALLVLYVTMVYGPIAAMLVELFPARIRYTSMSLPYHIGNGWFGGFLPTVAFAMVAASGNIYHGLWYPVIVALITFVVGLLLLPETRKRDIAR